MIITRTPFRVSFCGGGSDLKSFYEKHEGCVLSTSINKYVYLSIHPYFEDNKIALKYSKNEIVDGIDKIEHRIFKQVLGENNLTGVEIVSTADIPSGTGLGSSSSFTVGLVHAVNAYLGKYASKGEMAEKACDIEINQLGAPIGKQDQYAAAFGGINFIRFLSNGETVVEPVLIKHKTLDRLENNLMMFYTGITHDANKILAEQKNNMKKIDKTESLKTMCTYAYELKKSLETQNLDEFGRLLHENWLLKKQLASGVSNLAIDDAYETALKHGAKGGKLLGAGGGGFLLFYCEDDRRDELRSALGLREFPFKFEYNGTSIVHVGDKYWG